MAVMNSPQIKVHFLLMVQPTLGWKRGGAGVLLHTVTQGPRLLHLLVLSSSRALFSFAIILQKGKERGG